MMFVKHVKMLVPSELLYAFDPDSEALFVIARESGRLTARPASEAGVLPRCSYGHKKMDVSNGRYCAQKCIVCPCYDDLRDRCRHEDNCMEVQ